MGHKQLSFGKNHWKFRYNHGGALRQKRRGRLARPLSTRSAIHLVFKAQRSNLRRGVSVTSRVLHLQCRDQTLR